MTIVEVTREWTDEKGTCYECGDPAAFVVPDAYGPDHKLNEANLRCAICAANAAAYDGERIVGLFWDDADGEPSPEDLEIINTYPLAKEDDIQIDPIKGEILLHMPELEDHPNLDNLVRSIPKRIARDNPQTAGVVINEGGVVDWTSDNVTIIDFSEYKGRLDDPDTQTDDLLDIIEMFNSLHEDASPFPRLTINSMEDVANQTVERLQERGWTLVWSEKLGIKAFHPESDQSSNDEDENYALWITNNDTGSFAVYEPKENK